MSRWTIAPMTQAEAEEMAALALPGRVRLLRRRHDPRGPGRARSTRGCAATGSSRPAGPGGGLEGFVELKPKAPGAVEIGLGLRPDLTGRGLGAAFTAAAIQLAHDRGAERVTLAVAAFNLRAITVYERAGFVETGRHMRHIFGTDWEFIDMELR